jgi:hypothetical protein
LAIRLSGSSVSHTKIPEYGDWSKRREGFCIIKKEKRRNDEMCQKTEKSMKKVILRSKAHGLQPRHQFLCFLSLVGKL